MTNRILVVDDEPDVLHLVTRYLEKDGFEVSTAETGEKAFLLARSEQPALMVLDWMLPGISGLEICRIIKQDTATQSIRIVMLTARQQVIDRINGLETGADDYVTKPFSPQELVLRVKAILRRQHPPGSMQNSLSLGPLMLNFDLFEARLNGHLLDLTPTEFKLLTALAKKPRQVHSREALLNIVWGYTSAIETRTVDAHMRRLREKLESASEIVMTVRGFGYRIAPAYAGAGAYI